MALTNYQIIMDITENIIAYLEGEKGINEHALKAYQDSSITENDSEIRRMREREAVKLRDRITELSRHIEVIKRMYPKQ